MLKCFQNTFGVMCCRSKSDTDQNKEVAPDEPVVEDPKNVPELFYMVNVPDRPCPPGYKRDRTGNYLNLPMPTRGNILLHRDYPTNIRRLDMPVQYITGHQIYRDYSEKANECLLEVQCVNAPFGCTAEGTMAEMRKHQVICFYRWIRCSYHLQCGRHEISLSEYKKHLDEVHRPYIKKIRLNEDDEIVLKTDTHSFVRTGNILRIEGSNVYFVRRCLLDIDGDVLLICLHYIGENEEAKNYTYKVTISQGFNAKYTCTSYCLPYVENSNSCIKLPNCNVLKPSKLFLTKDYLREIHYSVSIKRI